METDAPPSADDPSEFVCTDAPPPCDDPEGTPAWQRALGLGSQVNYRRRLERERTAAAIQDEAIRRGDHDAAVIAGHQAHEAGQAARRDQKLLYRHAVRHQGRAERVPPAELRVRSVRPVARERRESSTRSSAKSGDSGDDGSGSEPPGARAGRHLHLVRDLPARQARYSYGCLTAAERGADVEPVMEP